jgi:hypothetical protein
MTLSLITRHILTVLSKAAKIFLFYDFKCSRQKTEEIEITVKTANPPLRREIAEAI